MSVELMGVVNITPDSFSDGGLHDSDTTAIAHAERLAADGATILDIGGESTRPGAERITPETELARITKTVTAMVAAGQAVSVDTLNASTARAVTELGAKYVNDVSGGLADPEIFRAVADSDAHYILGHWRGIPDLAQSRSQYDDVVADVRTELLRQVDKAVSAGIDPDRIILDPCLGFDKTGPQCWEIIRRVDELMNTGFRVLIGVSRKRMLKDVLDRFDQVENTPQDRDLLTSVTTALCAERGVWGVRVHDVLGSAQALAAIDALNSGVTSRVHHDESSPATAPADRIHLTGLRMFAHHGVFEFEREKGQTFVIDACVELGVRAGDAADNLEKTVNYAVLADELVAAAEREPVDLIETLAERLAAVALRQPGAERVTLTVHKPEAPIEHPFGDVSVTITRERTVVA